MPLVTPDPSPSDLTGKHFNWPLDEAWVSLLGRQHHDNTSGGDPHGEDLRTQAGPGILVGP